MLNLFGLGKDEDPDRRVERRLAAEGTAASKLASRPWEYAQILAVLHLAALGVCAGLILFGPSDLSYGIKNAVITSGWLHGIGVATAFATLALFPASLRMEEEAVELQSRADRHAGSSIPAVERMEKAIKVNQLGYRILVIAAICFVISICMAAVALFDDLSV